MTNVCIDCHIIEVVIQETAVDYLQIASHTLPQLQRQSYSHVMENGNGSHNIQHKNETKQYNVTL